MTYFKVHPRLSRLISRVAKHVFLLVIAVFSILSSIYAHPLAEVAAEVIDKIIYSGKCMQDMDSDVWLPYEPEDDINVVAEEAIASYKQQCDVNPNVIYLLVDRDLQCPPNSHPDSRQRISVPLSHPTADLESFCRFPNTISLILRAIRRMPLL